MFSSTDFFSNLFTFLKSKFVWMYKQWPSTKIYLHIFTTYTVLYIVDLKALNTDHDQNRWLVGARRCNGSRRPPGSIARRLQQRSDKSQRSAKI